LNGQGVLGGFGSRFGGSTGAGDAIVAFERSEVDGNELGSGLRRACSESRGG
jgi:hypothetical protein